VLSRPVVREERLSAVPSEFAGTTVMDFPRVEHAEHVEHAAARAQRSHTAAAVLFELLIAVAGRLSALVCPGHTRARVSGDEVMREELGRTGDVELVAARIEQALPTSGVTRPRPRPPHAAPCSSPDPITRPGTPSRRVAGRRGGRAHAPAFSAWAHGRDPAGQPANFTRAGDSSLRLNSRVRQ